MRHRARFSEARCALITLQNCQQNYLRLLHFLKSTTYINLHQKRVTKKKCVSIENRVQNYIKILNIFLAVWPKKTTYHGTDNSLARLLYRGRPSENLTRRGVEIRKALKISSKVVYIINSSVHLEMTRM